MSKLLSILLQRSDPSYPWGFTVRGGVEEGTLLAIDNVRHGTMAAQYLAPGDTILQIEKVDTRQLRHAQILQLITQQSKSLDLMVLKGTGTTSSSTRPFLRMPSSPNPRPASSQQVSSDWESGSSTWGGRNLRARKQDFWERVSSERSDCCKEGFTRLDSGTNSPFKTRQPGLGQWRRCQSEEKSSPRFDDTYNSVFSDSEERYSKYSNSNFDSSRINSVWSPTPSARPSSDASQYWTRDGKRGGDMCERQGDLTFWDFSPNSSYSSDYLNKTFKSEHSDFSRGYGSLSSEYASTAKTPEPSFDANESFMKKPSDFWGDHYRDEQGSVRLGSLPPVSNTDNIWKNSNISSKSEFKKSTSISKKSYSSSEGEQSFETFEHLNKTKETEKSSKVVDGGKEEVVEKTKKNKEYILANKEDVNGQPKESKKIVNDFKTIERVVDGEHEFCNKTKERSEEVTNSSTPVNFYDNVQQQGVESPPAQQAEKCEHSVKREHQVGFVEDSEPKCAKDDGDVSPRSFSPLFNMNTHPRRWATSTPIPEDDVAYQEEEPLQESYFEVDIRSPIDNQVVFSSSEEVLGRQSSQLSGGGSPIPVSPQGDAQVVPPCPPAPPPPPPPGLSAPPPPPPPGLPGSLPSVRLSTEIPEKRRSAYEPPAAIQNAMMTKDKKPFTYTPGGLDLSEIRSPRMARRISRNAHAPDLVPSQPRPSPLANQPLPPSAVAAMQPQIAVAVLPQGGPGVTQLHHVTPGGHSAPSSPAPPPPPPQPKMSPASPQVQNIPSPQPPSPQRVMNRQPSPPPMAVPKLQPQHRHTKSEPQSTPGSIYVPPIEPQQQEPPRAQLGSLYIPPLVPQEPVKPQSPVSQLNKAPTPWMSRQSQQAHNDVPPWVNKDNVQCASPQPQNQSQQAQTRIIPIQVEGKEQPQSQSQPVTRIIPIQLEGTPSPQYTPEQPNFNQQPNYQQQQQYQQQQYQQQQQQYQQQQQQYQQQQQQYQQQQQQYQQQPTSQGRQTPRWMNQQPVYVHNKFNSGSQSPVPVEQDQGDNQHSWRHSQSNGTMQSPGPVQSRSFKVLEKITGTDNGGVDQSDAPYNSQGVPLSQLRKMQLSDDDRALMNKVKAQVDDETYLHNESDPRYRGSAIPSRAFRILQNMTDGAGDDSDVPRAYSPVQQGQNRLAANRTPQPDAPQQYVPPSEQQVQEPRKYTGGAIPSRSFRMLQAMTAGSENADRPGESEY